MAEADPCDPKGLIRESYLMVGITAAECRSIFLDWALSLPVDADPTLPALALLARHGGSVPDHPMTATLRAGLTPAAPPRRRGGRQGRIPS